MDSLMPTHIDSPLQPTWSDLWHKHAASQSPVLIDDLHQHAEHIHADSPPLLTKVALGNPIDFDNSHFSTPYSVDTSPEPDSLPQLDNQGEYSGHLLEALDKSSWSNFSNANLPAFAPDLPPTPQAHVDKTANAVEVGVCESVAEGLKKYLDTHFPVVSYTPTGEKTQKQKPEQMPKPSKEVPRFSPYYTQSVFDMPPVHTPSRLHVSIVSRYHKHVQEHGPVREQDEAYVCVQCPKGSPHFASLEEYARHLDTHGVLNENFCPDQSCPYHVCGFRIKAQLRRHVCMTHLYEYQQSIRDPFRNSPNRDRELEQKCLEVVFVCSNEDCKRAFYRQDLMRRHERLLHKAPERKRRRVRKPFLDPDKFP